MKAFTEPFLSLDEIGTLVRGLAEKKKIYGLTGCVDGARSSLLHALSNSFDYTVYVASTEDAARELMQEYLFFDEDACFFPAKDLLFYQSDIRGNAIDRERLEAIRGLTDKQHLTVFTSVDALHNRFPSARDFLENTIHLKNGTEAAPKIIVKQLIKMGYESVETVEGPGEFALRGGILDIFSMTEQYPVRVEFWGDEIDSIRSFDAISQKSIENLEETRVYPAGELMLSDDEIQKGLERVHKDADPLYEKYRVEMKTEEAFRLKTMVSELEDSVGTELFYQKAQSLLPYFCSETYSLLDELPEDTLIIIDEPGRLSDRGQVLFEEFKESMIKRLERGDALPLCAGMLLSKEEVASRIASHPAVLMSGIDSMKGAIKPTAHFYLHSSPVTAYQNNIKLLIKELSVYHRQKYRIMLLSSSKSRGERLADNLRDEGVEAFYSEGYEDSLKPGTVMVTAAPIRHGFVLPDSSFVAISEADIFGAKKKKRKKRYHGESAITAFRDLSVGDYVVHENYGLGIYQGIEEREIVGTRKDYLKIQYAKGENLYIPATALDVLSKYGTVGGRKPKLSSLGSAEWTNTKSKVKSAVGIVAKELVDLYALRQQAKGYVYGKDTVWQREFEEAFPYEETEGQNAAIEDVKHDMESDKIMDRLICGDVGYGKTEIALRAAFKAVQEGKQVVYLCPTTILAQQHYATFSQRMKDYPVEVEMLSRFRTAKENNETVKRLKKGEVDVVIGTHRVLSKDVGYKDLGLLIIDEEQRFGVTHKEKIKQLKKTVDVLSLSATPIPRTLHMSLIGIRDMSILDEAPQDRMPIQTFVFEQNEEMVREAIERELARDGQVYYVINSIRSIADMASRIQKLVPDAQVAYAHGRMSESRLEDIMNDFLNREIDVLVTTTIIEIGLDISNVNTIIIHDADRFGLSQLYQLRGRVGRSNRSAYAFLMYKRDKVLKEVAEKRLSAIREFTDLGSGFKIAMRDLEIRGAGNLLGEEQHGHMDAVGYDLYCKLLSEAVSREKGDTSEETFVTTVDMDIDAFIPEGYITGEEVKLDIYKRISGIETEEEKDEMTDELIDRFGDPPKSVMNLLMVSRLKYEAHRAYFNEIRERGDTVTLTLVPQARLFAERIPEVLEKYSPLVEFQYDPKAPYFRVLFDKNNKVKKTERLDYIVDFVGFLNERLVER